MLQIKEPGTQIGNLFKFYARQRQKRRVLSRAPVDHEIRVQEEWEEGGCCCCSSARTATVAASQPELTTQSCHSTVLHATDSGRLGEKLMKSHKSQTSGTLCTFYELLLCSALLCCALLCFKLRSMPSGRGSRRRFEGTKAPLSTKATRTQPQLQQQLLKNERETCAWPVYMCVKRAGAGVGAGGGQLVNLLPRRTQIVIKMQINLCALLDTVAT